MIVIHLIILSFGLKGTCNSNGVHFFRKFIYKLCLLNEMLNIIITSAIVLNYRTIFCMFALILSKKFDCYCTLRVQ